MSQCAVGGGKAVGCSKDVYIRGARASGVGMSQAAPRTLYSEFCAAVTRRVYGCIAPARGEWHDADHSPVPSGNTCEAEEAS